MWKPFALSVDRVPHAHGVRPTVGIRRTEDLKLNEVLLRAGRQQPTGRGAHGRISVAVGRVGRNVYPRRVLKA